ncbi:MFS transporter [Arenicella sp. 4NH20-0111]|uniref:MFS transporter n=1 Tax=Arenicella sp. 4NH20-0111 TaxID=3127648 RepID=UPI0031090848
MPATKILFSLLVLGTVLGLAGTDLVLPAIPSLPASLTGTIEQSQLVIATFVAGTAIGLLIFGELGARYDQRLLMLLALIAYGLLSLLATQVDSLSELISVRFFQGLSCSAPAVFAPGIIKSIFDERGALRAIGLMGSIESLTPALAPILGTWLLSMASWKSSFYLTAILAFTIAFIWAMMFSRIPKLKSKSNQQGYGSLLLNREFMVHSLSHACTLGGLLIFVFGAPTVIIRSMGGDLSDFVTMQIIGISLFIVSANCTHWFVEKLGRDNVILFGSLLTAAGCFSVFLYGLSSYNNPKALWLLFVPINLGLGLRGPPGFHRAVVAAGENDARGAAVLILAILATAAIGTAISAAFIEEGLTPLACVAFLFALSSPLILLLFKSHLSQHALK